MDTEYLKNFLRTADDCRSLHCDKNSDWKSRCMLMFTITFFGRGLTDKLNSISVSTNFIKSKVGGPCKGSFNNYVDKMRGRGSKNVCFCPRSGYKNCPRRGGGSKKMAKFCPRSC